MNPISDLAEAVANWSSIRAASRDIGISQNMGARLCKQICRELGEQAR
jgi:hypothetical protein